MNHRQRILLLSLLLLTLLVGCSTQRQTDPTTDPTNSICTTGVAVTEDPMDRVPKESSQLQRAYIYATARNAALSILRKKSREVETVSMEELPLPSGDDPVESVIHRANYEELLTVISQLPLIQREIILMRYVQGLEVREVATALCRTPNYIRVQTFRAKGLLLQICRKEGINIAGTETTDSI